MQRQHTPSNGLAALTPSQLLAAFQLPAYRLYPLLHSLGTWPAGVWHATNAHALPRGSLLVVQLHPSSNSLQLQLPRPRVLEPPPPGGAGAWDLQPSFALAVSPASAAGCPPTWQLSAASGLHCALQLSLDGQQLMLHRSLQPRAPPATPGMRTLVSGGPAAQPQQQGGPALASLARYLGLHSGRLQLESLQYRRVQLPQPTVCQAPAGLEGAGLALLDQHQVRYFL